MLNIARVCTFGLALGATIAVAPASAATVQVNQATIVAAMAKALPGDTLVLAAGGYGVVVLPKKSWQTPITIDARSAQLAGVVIYGASGVNWLGGRIIGTGYGISIRDAARVSVKSAEISTAQRGIVINNATDVQIVGNRLHDLQTDGIDVVGQRVLVEANVITDMHPLPDDHPDGIQIWSATDKQTTDITVRNNTVTGRMQGIFSDAKLLGLNRLTVTGNKITVAYGNGIALLDAANSKATGNTVKNTPVFINKANMRVVGTQNVACSNYVPAVPTAVANLPCTG